MSKLDIMNSMSRTFNKVGFSLKKHSPEILLAAGIVGAVSSAVMACKATTKLSGILEESKESVDQVHDYVEKNGYSEQYSEQDYKKDLTVLHVQTGLKVVKLYAPAVILGTASIASILAGHKIIRTRNAALSAAYAAIDHSFKEYRGRVVERFGKELDRELKYNIKAQEVEETVTDAKGKEKIVKKTVEVVDPSTISDYARFFDETATGWHRDPEYNRTFLQHQQRVATDRLRAKGYLFLNDVYEMLGMSITKAGQVVGWIYDEKNPVGDNFVDFGIFDINKPKNRDFVNGYEQSILLDFNVDGNILDLM